MYDGKTTNLRRVLRRALDETLNDNIEALIHALKDAKLTSFSRQLVDAKQSHDLVREVFRRWVMQPEDQMDTKVVKAREYLGWKVNSKSFNGLKPEFLDVIYLLPPRKSAVIETLLALLETQQQEPFTKVSGTRIGTLFDIGTGTGILMRILRKVGIDGEMLGIDPARRLANYALNKFSDTPEVTIRVKKIEEFSRQAEVHFQMALCYMVLHHVRDHRKALKNVFDALLEGGLFVYTDKLYDRVPENGKPEEIDFTTATETLLLKSGQDFEIQPAKLTSVQPFKPHPEKVKEYDRRWKAVAEALSKIGFLIQCAKPLNENVVLFVCRKPHSEIWNNITKANVFNFSKTSNKGASKKNKGLPATIEGPHPPYHFTLKILRALYEAITGEVCSETPEKIGKGFLKGIAYFSWEKASRLFLVRRAFNFDFHILSYSHVHEGWGSLGRMLEEFEKDPVEYVERIGYSCLTRDAIQRTLPFQGDIKHLKYEAAMAIPVYRVDRVNGHKLRGAFLLYLEKPEHVPLHTGSYWQSRLVKKFKELNVVMNSELNKQADDLKIADSAAAIRNKWRKLARERREVVIAELVISAKLARGRGKIDPFVFSDVCSKIQAELSGSECFSVLDDRDLGKRQASILVAARFGISYDEIREKILAVIGSAAEDHGSFFYKCTRLGQE
jgi:SAM-dependent methyltransferase